MARISPGTMTAAIFAILVGLGGAYAVRQYLHQPRPDAPEVETAAARTIFVPAAIRDLEPGTKIQLTDVAILKFTPEAFAKSKHSKRTILPDMARFWGRILKSEVKRGDAFAPVDFYPEGAGPGLVENLKPGYRAVTIPIRNIGAVVGFARPGTIVDILFRSDAHEEYPEMTMTLLERVEVMAVGQTLNSEQNLDMGKGPATLTNVTLSVTPEQAKVLKVVESRGELTMTLRSPDDDTSLISLNSHRKITLPQLLGMPYIKRTTQMEIYRGGNKETMEFQEEVFHEEGASGYINTPIASEIPMLNNRTTGFPSAHNLGPGTLEAGGESGGESGGGESGGEAGGGAL